MNLLYSIVSYNNRAEILQFLCPYVKYKMLNQKMIQKYLGGTFPGTTISTIFAPKLVTETFIPFLLVIVYKVASSPDVVLPKLFVVIKFIRNCYIYRNEMVQDRPLYKGAVFLHAQGKIALSYSIAHADESSLLDCVIQQQS